MTKWTMSLSNMVRKKAREEESAWRSGLIALPATRLGHQSAGTLSGSTNLLRNKMLQDASLVAHFSSKCIPTARNAKDATLGANSTHMTMSMKDSPRSLSIILQSRWVKLHHSLREPRGKAIWDASIRVLDVEPVPLESAKLKAVKIVEPDLLNLLEVQSPWTKLL